VGAAGAAWWKNNSFTPHAIAADEVLRLVKEGAVTAEDVVSAVKGDKK
jgi:hypothetical protein